MQERVLDNMDLEETLGLQSNHEQYRIVYKGVMGKEYIPLDRYTGTRGLLIMSITKSCSM